MQSQSLHCRWKERRAHGQDTRLGGSEDRPSVALLGDTSTRNSRLALVRAFSEHIVITGSVLGAVMQVQRPTSPTFSHVEQIARIRSDDCHERPHPHPRTGLRHIRLAKDDHEQGQDDDPCVEPAKQRRHEPTGAACPPASVRSDLPDAGPYMPRNRNPIPRSSVPTRLPKLQDPLRVMSSLYQRVGHSVDPFLRGGHACHIDRAEPGLCD